MIKITTEPVLPIAKARKGFPLIFLFYSDENGLNWWAFFGVLGLTCCCSGFCCCEDASENDEADNETNVNGG